MLMANTSIKLSSLDYDKRTPGWNIIQNGASAEFPIIATANYTEFPDLFLGIIFDKIREHVPGNKIIFNKLDRTELYLPTKIGDRMMCTLKVIETFTNPTTRYTSTIIKFNLTVDAIDDIFDVIIGSVTVVWS